MIGMAMTYDPRQHELLNPELLGWCRRVAKGVSDQTLSTRLFCYRHRWYETFVIGAWIAEPMGAFIDLINLGGSLGNFNHAKAQEFTNRLYKPLTGMETAKQIRQAESEFLHNKQDEHDKQQDELRKRRRDYGY